MSESHDIPPERDGETPIPRQLDGLAVNLSDVARERGASLTGEEFLRLCDAVAYNFDLGTLRYLLRLWERHEFEFDWNPQRILMRQHSRYRLTRHGGFLVLDCPSSAADGQTTHLLWGWGTSSDLSRAARERPVLRADAETAERVKTIATESGVDLFHSRNFDNYVYDLDDQRQRRGKPFRERRERLNSLGRASTSIEVSLLDPTSAKDVLAILDVHRDWIRRHNPSATIDDEFAALQALLGGAVLSVDRLRVVGLRVDKGLVGFGVYDLLNPRVATAHFMKARESKTYAAATWQAIFDSAASEGAAFLNGGYDGGLPGLRFAKQSLRPCAMLRTCYVVSE